MVTGRCLDRLRDIVGGYPGPSDQPRGGRDLSRRSADPRAAIELVRLVTRRSVPPLAGAHECQAGDVSDDAPFRRSRIHEPRRDAFGHGRADRLSADLATARTMRTSRMKTVISHLSA